MSKLREYLGDASCSEQDAQIRVLLKLMRRLPFAGIWLASLMKKTPKEAFTRLVASGNLEDVKAKPLKLGVRQAERVSGRCLAGDESSFGYGLLSELEIGAVLAWDGQDRRVLGFDDRWLLTVWKSAVEQGVRPAALLLPTLELGERLLAKPASDEFFRVAKAAANWERLSRSAMDESHWRFHVAKYVWENPDIKNYNVHEVLEAVPENLRKRGAADSRKDGLRASEVAKFLNVLGKDCVQKKKKLGRPKRA